MSISTEIQRIMTAKTNIKTAIENKGVTVGDGTIDTYAEKIGKIETGGSGDYEQGYEDGKNSVIDFVKYAKTVQFNSLNDFGKPEIELNLDSCTTLVNLCSVTSAENRNNTVEHLTINCGYPTMMSAMLSSGYQIRDQKLKQLTLNFNTVNVTSFNNAFNCLQAVEIIDGQPLNLSNATNVTNMFNYNDALKEVRFVEKSIPMSINFAYSSAMSAETIQSIIDGLADLTGGTAQTLTLHATVGGKLTDEQKATITAKNWTLVY